MNLFLPRLFRVAFAVLAVLASIAAAFILVVMLVDPELQPDTRLGPSRGEFLGQPASIALQPAAEGQGESILELKAFNGSVAATVDRPAGVIERLKAFGLPVLLIHALFLAALFELLRRLFRNVGRGESFTPQSVRLVQIIGVSLMVFAFVAAIGKSWFAYEMYAILADSTQVAVSGTPVQLPPAAPPRWLGARFPLCDAAFLTGLLVLALAEVFRQGLALQRDNDLTV
jgi:hypothetical protein